MHGKSRWSLRRRRSSRRSRRRTLTPCYPEKCRRREIGIENLGFARHRPQPTGNECEGSAGAVFVLDYSTACRERDLRELLPQLVSPLQAVCEVRWCLNLDYTIRPVIWC